MSTLFATKPASASAATLADDPGYQTATTNANRIRDRIGQIENRLFELQQGPPPPSHAKARAAAIALGHADPGPLASGSASEARALAGELSILERALPLAEKHQADAQREASRAACKARSKEYLAIGGDIAASLRQLKAALLAESDFRDTLGRDGYDFVGLVPCAFIAVGQDSDYPEPFWQIQDWFKFMADSGIKLKM